MYKIYEAEVFPPIFKSANTRLTFSHNSKLVSFQFLLMQPVQQYPKKYPEIDPLKSLSFAWQY